jgi:integrase/recombinase XerD
VTRGDPAAAPPPRDADVEAYLDHLRVERGLSDNSLDAYGHDLAKLAAFARGRGRTPAALGQSELGEFIQSLHARGLAARSVARAVHALRGFYRFGLREGRLQADPMENLRAPRVVKPLPRFLTPRQVDALLAAPDTHTPLGLRDRAVLEVFYATGLRVSELIGLKPGDVDLSLGVLTAFGKGRKERLVPLGSEARRWVESYLGEVRPRLLRGRGS